MGALAAGDPGAAAGPAEVLRQAGWSPAEGNAGLRDRFARAREVDSTPADLITPFPLVAPAGDAAARAWREFCQAALGFVPAIGAAERARWQGFLAARYTIEEVAAADGAHYTDFTDVPLPRDFPSSVAGRAADWRVFCNQRDGIVVRERWRDFLARRHRRIERLNRAYATSWPDFQTVALPDALPDSESAQVDWLAFEHLLLPMHSTKHRFSVLLPVSEVATDPYEMEARIGLARRIVDLEKPAHTVYDVRFYWALFRVGEARLGLDTLLGQGSRAPELVPPAVLGRAYVGTAFVGGQPRPSDGDRLLLEC
jgi:hypothetical protein